MNSSHSKWVALSFLLFSALVSYLCSLGLNQLSMTYDWETRLRAVDLWIRLGSTLLGCVLFLFLFLFSKTRTFLEEVVGELAQVTWPTAAETLASTGIVIVMVLFSGLVLGLMDDLWTRGAGFIFN